MTKTPIYWNKAKKYLSKKDKIMKKLIIKYKSPSETILTSRKDIFFSLCKSIIGQQISVMAANSVFLKFKKRCKNKITAKTISRGRYGRSKEINSCIPTNIDPCDIMAKAEPILTEVFSAKYRHQSQL